MTSLIGTVLSRSGGVSLEKFNEKLATAFGRPSSLFVPVAMPHASLRHIKSATKRALGPHTDVQERSGIEYSMRMIGANQPNAHEVSEGLEIPVDEAAEEEAEYDAV